MGRNIVVFADGTGNSAATLFKTNVWRLYQALDLSTGEQLASFDDGVGTSSFRPLQTLGLALGVGIKRNVLDLYKFLCLNYQTGDRIFAFGFSRGAFTIRILNGLINREGLVRFESEEELQRNAAAAYRAYRKKAFPERAVVKLGRALRDGCINIRNWLFGARSYDQLQKSTELRNRHPIAVEFLGVWDTVGAYGLPIDELTNAVDRWVWPMSFGKLDLPGNVQFACQALSLDDERRTFFPLPWVETATRKPGTQLDDEKLVQIWFAGVHANVGGGYADDALSHVSLCWMISEAARRGLKFQEWTVAGYAAIASDNGLAYDSRASFGALYRYLPRDTDDLMNKDGNGAIRIRPLVDSSVILRMANGGDGYAPISLPPEFDVVAPDNTVVPFLPPILKADATKTAARHLPLPPGMSQNLAARTNSLNRALNQLANAGATHQRTDRIALVFDTVWWRRTTYFVTLGLVLAAAALPLIGPDDLPPEMREANEAAGWIAGFSGIAKSFLPGFAAPWLDAVETMPIIAGLLATAIFMCLAISELLRIRIHDRARVAWNVNPKLSLRMKRKRLDALHRAITLFAIAISALVVSILVGLGGFDTWKVLLPVLLGGIAILFFLNRQIERLRRTDESPDAIDPSGPMLRLARWIRLSTSVRAVSRFCVRHLFPLVFLAAAAFLVLGGANRLAFDIWSSSGQVCTSTKPENLVEASNQTINQPFNTNEMCWRSGVTVVEGARYRIQLTMTEGLDWFDRGEHTDIGGFESDWTFVLPSLFRRWWRENWFMPIARIGVRGNDEYPLAPVDPLLPAPKKPKDAPAPKIETGMFEPIPTELAKKLTTANPRGERRVLIAEFKARRSGELFLYVNDAVLMLPGLMARFYGNNLGTAIVSIERIKAPPVQLR